MVLGIGSLESNEKDDDDEEEEEPIENKYEAWLKLLDGEEGALSLKPQKEVTALKATNFNLANALRE